MSHTNWVLWNLASSVDPILPSHVASSMNADCQLLPSRGCQLARSPEALLPHLWTSRLKFTNWPSCFWLCPWSHVLLPCSPCIPLTSSVLFPPLMFLPLPTRASLWCSNKHRRIRIILISSNTYPERAQDLEVRCLTSLNSQSCRGESNKNSPLVLRSSLKRPGRLTGILVPLLPPTPTLRPGAPGRAEKLEAW